MSFSVAPSTFAPGASLTASGTGTKKRPYRITVAPEDPVMPGAILLEAKMPANGRFQALIHAPGGADRKTRLILRQPRVSDGVWAQTADVSVVLLAAAGNGGGTVPDPNPPPTPPPDIAPANIVASGLTTTSVNIAWTTADASTGLVRYWTNPAVKTSTASTSSGTSGNWSLTGLTPGQTYGYEVVTNSGSTTVISSPRTFTTTAAPTLPGAPTGLVATGGNAQVVLTWTAPSSNGGSAITGYRIFRNGVSLTTDPASPYTDSTVSNGTTYTYTVAAITAVGEGPQSASASATPAAAGDINPPVISNIVIGNVTTTSAQVSWSLNEPGTGQVDYGTTNAYGQQTALAGLLTSHSQTISGLQPNTTYHVRIRSADAAGNLALSSDRQFTTAQTTPVPTPTRPWALPVAPTIVNVASGANLQSIVNAASDGTTFVLASGATYSLSTGLALASRHNLIIQGDGTQTIKSNGPGGSSSSSVLYITGSTDHITVSRVTLQGTNPDTGTNIYHPGTENQMGLANYGGDYIELDRVKIRNTYGDFAYLSGGGAHIWLHDGDWDYCGRMGVAFIDCTDVLIERNTLSHIGLIAFDVEPNTSGEVINTIHIQDNTVGSWALSNYQTNWFFAYATPNGVASNFYVERNVCTLGPVAGSNNPAGISALSSHVEHSRVSTLVFRGNTTPVPGRAGVDGTHPTPLFFSHVDGLIVTGNTPPTTGSLSTVIDSPGAITSPNP